LILSLSSVFSSLPTTRPIGFDGLYKQGAHFGWHSNWTPFWKPFKTNIELWRKCNI
jgi:hypothetical protein